MRFFRAAAAVFLCLCCVLPVCAKSDTAVVPILMYHHFTVDPACANGNCITADAFTEQLAALAEAGYHSVTIADCIDFVDSGTPLPEHPLLLTADDGYRSVLDIALPIADRYGFSLTVAVIGSHITADTDGIPHFSLSEALSHPLANRLELLSHTYALHDADGLGVTADPAALPYDIALMRGLPGAGKTEIGRVFAYPFGKWNGESERILRDAGYRATLAIHAGAYRVAVLRPGDEGSLYAMPRIAVDGSIDGAELVGILAREKAKVRTEPDNG